MPKIFSILILLLFIISNCSKSGENRSNNQSSGAKLPLNLSLSPEEKSYLNRFKTEKNPLRVMIFSSIYKAYKGDINNAVLDEFIKVFGLSLKLKSVHFPDIYKHRGRLPKDMMKPHGVFYEPDILKEADLIVGNQTILAWRKKIFNMIEVWPARVLLVGKKNKELRSLKKIAGKKIGILKASSFVKVIRGIEKKLNRKIEIIEFENSHDGLNGVASGRFDLTLADSNQFIRYQINNPESQLSAFFPVSELQYLGWAVAKNNLILSSILNKFITHLVQSGKMDDIFLRSFKFSLEKYYEMVQFVPEKASSQSR